jgi:hypothetical protein
MHGEVHMESAVHPGTDDPGAGPEQVLLQWPGRVRVLANPIVWRNILLCFGIPCLLVGGLFLAISGEAGSSFLLAAGLFSFFMILFLLIGLAVDLFGGFRVRFTLTDRGLWSHSGKAARAAYTAAVVGGLVAGSAAAVGAGLLARSEQEVFIPWNEVSKVKVNPRRRHVLVKGSFLQKPIGLYCTAENFAGVLAVLRERCPASPGGPSGAPV